MRGRFLIAASDEYPAESVGGEKEVTLTIDELPEHTHGTNKTIKGNSSGSNGNNFAVYNNYKNEESTNARVVGITETKYAQGLAHNNMPPYYAILYIMKL